MIRRPPRSTRTDTLFPSTTLFRSHVDHRVVAQSAAEVGGGKQEEAGPEPLRRAVDFLDRDLVFRLALPAAGVEREAVDSAALRGEEDRKSTRLNSSH